jgi:hypothetical protein
MFRNYTFCTDKFRVLTIKILSTKFSFSYFINFGGKLKCETYRVCQVADNTEQYSFANFPCLLKRYASVIFS